MESSLASAVKMMDFIGGARLGGTSREDEAPAEPAFTGK
jgi:hypothetical protein